ncbi:putative GDP-fucose transporter, partial [Operophtera brumata]
VVSIATVFVNKTLLSSRSVALEAPLFITWFQCLVSFTICSLLSTSGGIPGFVGVPFYYVGRSLTTVFNVIFSWVLLGQTTSYKCISCCAFIIFGFYLGVDQERSLMLTLYSIYTKKVLPSVNQEVCLLSYYNNAYSIILFIPLILVNGEATVLMNYGHFHSVYFWAQMLVGGLCGFAIGYFTSLQIKDP